MTLTKLHRELTENKVVTSSRPYLSKLVKEGKIPFSEVKGRKHFNYDEVVKALADSVIRPEKPHNAKGKVDAMPTPKEGQSAKEYEEEVKASLSDNPSLTDSKIFLTIYQGKNAQLKYDIESGKLVYREEVEQKAFSVVRVLRDQILAIPERLAGEVASSNDPKEIKEMMYKEINEVLKYLSSEEVLYD